MKRLGLILGLLLFLLGIVAVVHPTFEYGTRELVAKFGPLVATLDEPLVSGLALVVISSKMKS